MTREDICHLVVIREEPREASNHDDSNGHETRESSPRDYYSRIVDIAIRHYARIAKMTRYRNIHN